MKKGIALMILLMLTAAALAGWTLELEALQGRLLDLVNAVFGLLAILGIVNDPTTQGYGDSARALGYETPAK